MTRPLVLALVGASLVGLAMPAFGQDDMTGMAGMDMGGSRADRSGAPADGFLGPRPFLTTLSAADQKLLASLIDKYTSANDNAVIKVHENTMMDPKLFDVHKRPYTRLFTFHHAYLQGLEDYLKQQGYAKFVPLPKWDPSTPIPKVFGYHNGKKVIQNFNPKQDWSQFHHSKLGVFVEDIWSGPNDKTPDAKVLANTLVVPHNNTHNTIAGIMSTMSSPTAPIFWCYHAFIDDIWTDWKSVHAHPPKSLGGALDEAPEVRSIQGIVRSDNLAAGAVTLDEVGTDKSFVVDEPWASLLRDSPEAADKAVWVRAKEVDGKLEIESVSADNAMSSLRVHSKASLSSSQIGSITPMSEIRIVGQKGDFFKVQLGDGRKGYVAKSVVTLGGDPVTDASSDVGSLAPAGDGMDGMDMGPRHGMTENVPGGGDGH